MFTGPMAMWTSLPPKEKFTPQDPGKSYGQDNRPGTGWPQNPLNQIFRLHVVSKKVTNLFVSVQGLPVTFLQPFGGGNVI